MAFGNRQAWLVVASFLLLQGVARASDPELPTVQVENRKFLGIGGAFGRWPGAIPWVYNPNNAPASFSDANYAVDLIQQSMDLWSDVSGITFDFQGTDTQADVANTSDGVVTVAWVPGLQSAGLAGPAFNITNQDIIDNGHAPYDDGTVRINPDSFSDMGSTPADTRDAELGFVRTMGHEVGHLMGFGHSDDPLSILYANPYNFIPHLRDDDIAGAQALYGPPPSFTQPLTYTVPPLTSNGDISNTKLIDQNGNTITQMTDADTGVFAFVRLDADINLTDELYVVVTDPTGLVISESSFDAGVCNSQICTRTSNAVANQLTARYLPGDWSFHIIVGGQRVQTLSLDLNTNPETFNAPPDGVMTISKLSGAAPLTITVGAEVAGDAEGDNAKVIFHLPTEGETVVELGGSTGSPERTITLTQPGEYDLLVDIDDDSVRYTNAQAGFDNAGTGFRKIFRRRVSVFERTPIMLTQGEPINQNASAELASLIPPNNGQLRVQVNDPSTGALIRRSNFLTDAWHANQIVTVPGISSSGTAVGVFATRISDNLPIGQFKDAASGAPVGNVFPLSANWNLIKVAVLPNVVGNGAGVAVLAKRSGDQLMIVQVRDPSNNALVRNINPLGFGWSAKDMVSLDVDGTPAVGVMATRNGDNLVIIQVRDATDGSLVRNVFPLGLGWSAQELRVVPDLDGNNVDELAVRMTRDLDGLEIIQIRDASTNNLVGNVYPIGAGAGGWTTRSFAWMDNNGGNALAILSSRDSDGQVLVQERNLTNASVIRNVFFLGTPWVAGAGFSILPDFNGNGVSELAVAVDNTSNGSRLIQVRDGGAGNVIRNFAVVP